MGYTVITKHLNGNQHEVFAETTIEWLNDMEYTIPLGNVIYIPNTNEWQAEIGPVAIGGLFDSMHTAVHQLVTIAQAHMRMPEDNALIRIMAG